jgi:hypothetical protein
MSEQTIQNIELQLAEISSQEPLLTETTEITELPIQTIDNDKLILHLRQEFDHWSHTSMENRIPLQKPNFSKSIM